MFYLLIISFVLFLLIVGITLYQRSQSGGQPTVNDSNFTIREISDQEFEELTGTGVVLIDFWAPWCSPCRMQAPVIRQIAKEMQEEVKCFKINVDDHKKAARRMKIKNIPNIIIFRDGEPVRQIIGSKPKHLIMKALKDTLDGN